MLEDDEAELRAARHHERNEWGCLLARNMEDGIKYGPRMESNRAKDGIKYAHGLGPKLKDAKREHEEYFSGARGRLGGPRRCGG